MRGHKHLLCLAGVFIAEGAAFLSTGVQVPNNLFLGTRTAGCPLSCSDVGVDPSNWTQLHGVRDLARCNGTFILDMNVQTPAYTVSRMRVCNTSGNATLVSPSYPANATLQGRSPLELSTNCGAKVVTNTTSITTSTNSNDDAPMDGGDVSLAAQLLSSYLEDGASCGRTILFSNVNNVLLGMYVGSEMQKAAAVTLVQLYSEHASDGVTSLQACNLDYQGASKTFGVFATALDNFVQAQEAVKAWANGECLKGSDPSHDIVADVGFLVSVVDVAPNSTSNSTANITSVTANNRIRRFDPPLLHSRAAECTTVKVVSGDSCASLATECGITGNQFEQYNSDIPNLCSTLAVGQFVCCTEGTLPDPTPQPNPDGSCHVYTIQPGDYCSAIASSYYLTVDKLNGFNKQTWGWSGCDFIEPGQLICLSNGTAPFPAPVQGTQCGPTVPGTVAPASGTNISMLNPCPLNACCDAWGFCGVTTDFCTETPADTGSPGTHKNGTNGCISNCGTDIISEPESAPDIMTIGYFEGYNYNRSCLYMDVSQIPAKNFSRIHFGFGTIAPDFSISMDDVDAAQWAKFSGNADFPYQRVLTFGGWAFSTDPATYNIFRTGVQEANREKLALNVAEFVLSNWMDGVDFDWEYPGAPDIPGIPAGSAEDGANYLEFLKRVRHYIGEPRTISIALPASFWYLKAFPVAEMAEVVDYFVYMTYDLHGQWDFANSNADDGGCVGGNCLRSHVNKTETATALSMITKAGVSSHKIVMGVSMYGRSFRMSDSTCSGPMCTYTGGFDASEAMPGMCTDTAGYLADAEIADILADTWPVVSTYYDRESDTNVLMYGNSEEAVDWVAYENATTRDRRLDWAILELNMAGTVAWAIDLENELDYVDDDNSTDYVVADLDISCDPAGNPGDLGSLTDQLDSIEPRCWNQYAMDILMDTLDGVLDNYTTVSVGYDDVYSYYVKWVQDMIGPSLHSYMDFDTGKGNKYFSCSWTWGVSKGSSKCPPSAHIWQAGVGPPWTVTYTLDDANGFYAAVEADLGIEQAWIKFGEYEEPVQCADSDSDRPGGGNHPCQHIINKREGFPIKSDSVTVSNPKQIIAAASSNITALQSTLTMGYSNMALGDFDGNDTSSSNDMADNTVTASVMPIYMFQQAVNSMVTIKDIGAKAKAEAQKNLILEILGIVLIFIPFVGEGLGAAFGGAAQIARIATLIGEAGNAALGIQQVVSDPLSAPVVILGLLAGVGGLAKSDREVFEDAAAARKAMSANDLAKFSDNVKKGDGFVQNIVNKCVIRSDDIFVSG